jgi:hypothetical protein
MALAVRTTMPSWVRTHNTGFPVYCVRRRRIDELHEQVVTAMSKAIAVAPDIAGARRTLEKCGNVDDAIRELANLISRCYPVEADLPIDPSTGELLDGGKV